jgi:hypothetical protein
MELGFKRLVLLKHYLKQSINKNAESIMQNSAILGIDLAKYVFQIYGTDA